MPQPAPHPATATPSTEPFDHILDLARADALKALHRELLKAESTAEVRRCAVAILAIRKDPPAADEDDFEDEDHWDGDDTDAPNDQPPKGEECECASTNAEGAAGQSSLPLPPASKTPPTPALHSSEAHNQTPSLNPAPRLRSLPYSPRSCPPITPTIPNFAHGSSPPMTRLPTSPFRTSRSAPS